MKRTVSMACTFVRLHLLAALLLGVWLSERSLSADDLETQEEQAFKQATVLAEPSVVRIDTVGGIDLVGELLTGTGSTTGVVVSTEGHIITSSFNFVSKPSGIIVTLADGRRLAAEVVSSDAARMLTLLKVDAAREGLQLQPLRAAPRDGLRVGQWSIALGRTYDLAFPNMSVGILSGLNRVWGRAMQTDAKISPANYGGPLIDIEGRGIGILVPLSPQKTEETAGVEWYDGGIGFAIPLEDVYRVLDRLKQGENLQPGLIGLGFPDQGVLAGEARINRVRPESPADQAGLLEQDLIFEVDGHPIHRVPDLRHLVGRKYAGDKVALAIRRGEETIRTEVTLAAELLAYESGYLGILPSRLPIDMAVEGVEVREVFPDSPAAKAGLQRRDVITRCDGISITDAASLLSRIDRRRPGETCELTFFRNEAQQVVGVTLGSMPETVMENLPASNIPAPSIERMVADEMLGKSTAILDGDVEKSYWRYVPNLYNPDYSYGLVVWLHPAGDTMEASILRAWQQHCDRRGLILVAPKSANLATGWNADEIEFVRNVIAQVQRDYRIDAKRISVHGHAEGGRFAWDVAFKQRDLFQGIINSSAPLRTPPPDNDPDYRQQIAMIGGANDPLLDRIVRSVEVLKTLKFPTLLINLPEAGPEYPGEETIDQLARWLDSLDRI